MSVRGLALSFSIAGMLLGGGTPARAEPAATTMDLAAIQKLVANLGYEDASDHKTSVLIEGLGDGSRKFGIWLAPGADGKSLLFYTMLNKTTKAKIKNAPLEKMLEYGNTNEDYFVLNDQDDDRQIYLQYRLATPAVTPAAVRAKLDEMAAAAKETEALWNAEKWSEASTR